MPSAEVLAQFQQQVEEATQLRVALSRGEFGTLKHDLLVFLATKPMFRDLAKPRWFRPDHTSTAALLKLVDLCMARVHGADAHEPAVVLAHLKHLSQRAQRLETLWPHRAGVKQQVVNFLEDARTPAVIKGHVDIHFFRRTLGRATHFPSQGMVWKLREAANADDVITSVPELVPVLNEFADTLISHTQKLALKQEINATLAGLTGIGKLGSERWIRKDHAPIGSLRRALADAEETLEELVSPERRTALLSQLQRFKALLRQRLNMKQRLAEVDAASRASMASLESGHAHVKAFARLLADKRRKLDADITALELQITTASEALDALEAELEAKRDTVAQRVDEMEATEAGEVPVAHAELLPARAKVAELEAARVERIRELKDLDDRLARLESERDDVVQVQLHCLQNLDELETYVSRAKATWERYKETKVLVFYFGVRDNIFEKLMALGRFVRGNRDDLDALGQLQLLFAFDVGVRAGVELGCLSLGADVQITLTLTGGLAVLDSREFLFRSRVAVYLSAGVGLKLGPPAELAAAAGAASMGLVKPPEVLLEAGARVGCMLFDREACEVFESEEHWAYLWAHGLARRIAFLRRFDIRNPVHREGSEDWVEAALREISEHGVVASAEPVPDRVATVAGPEALVPYQRLLAVERGQLEAMKRKPVRELVFRQHARLEAEAHVEVAVLGGRSVARSPGRATFDVTRGLAGSPAPATALCTLEEDSARWTGAEDESERGTAVYHRVVLPGGKERAYLEVDLKRVSSTGGDTVTFDFARGTATPPATPDQRLGLARLLSALARSGSTDAPYPFVELLGEQVSVPETDRQLLARRSRGLLGVVSAGKHGPSLRDRVIGYLSNKVAGELDLDVETALRRSSAAYVRFALRQRFSVVDGSLTWTPEWVPQVYRGMSHGLFRLSAGGDIPVITGLSIHLGATLEFRRDCAVFEVLGTDTLGYLKLIFGGLQARGGWDAFWRAHWLEIQDILAGVSNPECGPFNEVAWDATRADASPALKRAAVALGRACWEHFEPGAADTPFEAVGTGRWKLALHDALSRVRKRGAAAFAELDAARLEASWRRVAPSSLNATLGRMVEAGRGAEEIEQRSGARVKQATPGLPASAAALTAQLSELARAWSARQEAARPALPPPAGAKDVRGLLLEAAKRLLERLGPLEDQLLTLDRALGERLGTHRPVTKEQVRTAAEDAGAELLLRPVVVAVGHHVHQPSLVPAGEKWNALSKDNVSFFTARSKATQILDEAVAAYHRANEAQDREDVPRVPRRLSAYQREPTDEGRAALVSWLEAALSARRRLLATLQQAITTWKGDRQDNKSARLAAVRMHLERPVLEQGLHLDTLAALLEIRCALVAVARERRFLEDAVRGRSASATDETRAKVHGAALKLLRLAGALKAYLAAAHEEMADDVLMTGLKKLPLPGGSAPEAEPKPDEAPPPPPAPPLRREVDPAARSALWGQLRGATLASGGK
ncbi:MAG: hypothetical protein RL653_231 [Pseudomonadota bacterium]